jgi:SAM-dependent methyltransferase
VLDIGPGSGSHVSLFSQDATAIYGAEPTTGLHKPLQARIDEAKLTNKYHVLACTADKAELLPALAKEGVTISPKGIFDTIVCIRVLCSVPNLEETIRDFHSLLKPGGELMVVEHIKNPWTKNGSIVARGMQIVYHLLGWTFFLAGCEMNRDTPAVLRKAAPWDAVELKTHFLWSALPYVSGTLTKKTH